MWKTIDRIQAVVDPKAPPALNEAVRKKIRSFFVRYESRKAALLPALHIVQDALGSITPQAMMEVADLLEIHPSDVTDAVSFYAHFWTHRKGRKVITACRSIACEAMGAAAVINELKRQLGIDEHETTADGAYSLTTEECLAGCDYAPCLLINERLHKRVKPQDVAAILADAENDRITVERSPLFDAPKDGASAAEQETVAAGGAEKGEGDGSASP